MKQFFSYTLTLSLLIGLAACSGDNAVQNESDPPSESLDSENSVSTDAPVENITLSPEETLARLIELARAGDWETYVDDFYGESHKFEGMAERRDAVVARFREKWATEVLSSLEAIDDGDADISDDGKKAVFFTDREPSFNLFLSDDGRWTFHL